MNRIQMIAISVAVVGALVAATWMVLPTRAIGSVQVAHPTEPHMSNVLHLNAEAFPKVVAQSKPVIIDFWAPWCGPCRTQGPILDEVSVQLGDKAIVTKVNVDDERELAAKFGVQSIPTLVILRDGKVVKQFVGVQQAATLIQAVN